ncbi:MAG: PIN domain-containing protein [Methanomassiliicoccales archaeon]|nr:MAG: PIN domain-containing protein [Methanomassiliicoccales archaeon]
MKDYVVDTIALVSYLKDDLPPQANKIFKSAEQNKCKLLLPEIVVGEFIYISLKGRLKASHPKSLIMEVLISLNTSRYISFVGMDVEAWEEFLALNIPELHDRMICSIASTKDAAVITNDDKIRKNQAIETIWD